MEYIRENERRVLQYFDAGVDGKDSEVIKITLNFALKNGLCGFWICRRSISAPKFPWEGYAKVTHQPVAMEDGHANGVCILDEMPEFLSNRQMQTILCEGVRYTFVWLKKGGFNKRKSEVRIRFGSDPARVSVLWVDMDGNVHEEPDCEKIIPIRISYTRRMVTVKSGFDVAFSFAKNDEVCEDALYYTVDGKPVRYPIPKEIIRGGKELRFVQCEGVSIHLKESYRDILKLE